MAEDRLVSMLRQQRELQHRMGHLHASMTRKERVEHIKDMYIAAVNELGEALDETSWKPWTVGESRLRKHAVGGELSDAFQFMMNMWFAAYPELSDEELADRMVSILEAKLAINEMRRTSGYDGVSSKCGGCKRALDDPAVMCTREGDQGYCIVDNADINYITSRDTVAP